MGEHLWATVGPVAQIRPWLASVRSVGQGGMVPPALAVQAVPSRKGEMTRVGARRGRRTKAAAPSSCTPPGLRSPIPQSRKSERVAAPSLSSGESHRDATPRGVIPETQLRGAFWTTHAQSPSLPMEPQSVRRCSAPRIGVPDSAAPSYQLCTIRSSPPRRPPTSSDGPGRNCTSSALGLL